MDDARLERLAGFAGLAGAFLFFAGDMLLYGHLGSAQGFAAGARAVMLAAAPQRLYAGGLLGPLGALLYLAGYWHVYRQVDGRSATIGRVMYVAFCAFSLAAATVHALTTESALVARACIEPSAACSALKASVRAYEDWAYNAAQLPGYLAAILLGYLVISGRTAYPRWTFVANPGLLIPLAPLFDHIPAPLGAAVVGGYINIAVSVFFAVSLLTTASKRSARPG